MNNEDKPMILVVDDRQDTLTPVIDMLRANYRVIARTTIEEGKKELRIAADKYQSSPSRRFAVVIADLRFDNLDGGVAPEAEKKVAGLEIVTEARADEFCEVIMITAYSPEEADDALERGVFRYIGKVAKEQMDASWLEDVRKAVDQAVAVRDRWLNLWGDLHNIYDYVSELDRANETPDHIVFGLQQSVDAAFKNFDTLLRGRGHRAN